MSSHLYAVRLVLAPRELPGFAQSHDMECVDLPEADPKQAVQDAWNQLRRDPHCVGRPIKSAELLRCEHKHQLFTIEGKAAAPVVARQERNGRSRRAVMAALWQDAKALVS